jgi:hypothetical protein
MNLQEVQERLEQIKPKFDRTEPNFGLEDTDRRFLKKTLTDPPQVMTKDISIKIQKDSTFHGFVLQCRERFLNFDWGNMHQEDLESNDECLLIGERILASYTNPIEPLQAIWIIADALLDTGLRQEVIIMLPSDY